MGKNKLARWNELGSYGNVIQPETSSIPIEDHHIKGRWNTEMFRNENPVVLELGCGKGEYTTGLALKFPERNFIGIDIKGARMWRGAKTSNEQNLKNVAFLRTRIEFINRFFADDEVSEIWITFPDPHPGGTNAGKRLTSPFFLNNYRKFLVNNGLVHLKTDNTELYKYTRAVAEYNDLEIVFATSDLYSFSNEEEPKEENEIRVPAGIQSGNSFLSDLLAIKTHYEKIFIARALKINYLCFRLKKEKTIGYVFPKAKS
jgi:tRNA (guanine-N7-)-methyltransferase